MTKTKNQDRRELAAVYLKDAGYEGSSWRSRADCAGDAVYLYALLVLGADADGYEHPDAQALTDAAERLGVACRKNDAGGSAVRAQIRPAISLQEAQVTYEELISLAKELGAGT